MCRSVSATAIGRRARARERALIGGRAVAVQAGMGRRRAARQRHRDAVAGEAGDHRRLVAEPEQPRLARAGAPAIGYAGDRLPLRRRHSAEPLGEQGRFPHQLGQQRLAPSRHPRLRDGEAEIGRPVLLQQQPGIAASVEMEFDRSRQVSGWRDRGAKADGQGAVVDGTDGAAQLVLAGGQEERLGGHLAAVVEPQAAFFQ